MSKETDEKTSGISGKRREQQEFGKLFVGLGEVKVICVNPSREEYKEILGMDLKEESKADEYLGESKEHNTTVRIDVWVENTKTKKRDKIVFFLENKKRENKDGTKKQYINNIGACSWADDPNNLPEWFSKRSFREAYNGEEELYTFMRTWLGSLDYKDAETVLQIEWKKLLKGNVSDIREQIGGEYAVPFLALYTVKSVEKAGETKQFQSIYNKAFLPSYNMKNFRLTDYSKDEVLDNLKGKKSADLKPHERFALQVSDSEHGCKDAFVLKELKEYNADDFLQASDEPLVADDPSY